MHTLTYYLPAFTVTRKKEKKKKTPGTTDNNISNHRRGKKKKYHKKKKKKKGRRRRKGQFRHTSWKKKKKKNQERCNQLVKRKIKTHRKLLQCYNYKSAQYKVESITKIKSRVRIFLLKFHLNGSSGSFVPTWKIPPRNIYIYIYIYSKKKNNIITRSNHSSITRMLTTCYVKQYKKLINFFLLIQVSLCSPKH